MTYGIAFPLLALAALGGCNSSDVTGGSGTDARSSIKAGVAEVSELFPRSGELHVTKECTEYRGLAGGFCTITSSNIAEIEAGSRVIYASNFVPPTLDSDLVLDTPGPGNNGASGHVVLALAPGTGTVTFSGGTGKFTHFTASVVVTRIGAAALKTWAWDGTYSFDPRN